MSTSIRPVGAAPTSAIETNDAKEKKAHELAKAAHDFEAILVRSMLGESGAMGKSSGAYGDMALGALAGAISDGKGIGLGEAIRNAVERAEASRSRDDGR